MSKRHISASVNGDPVEFLADPGMTLLDALRDELGLTGSKEGCGSGDCGACSVMVDGRLVCSCLMLAAEAEGRRIETIDASVVTLVSIGLVNALIWYGRLHYRLLKPAIDPQPTGELTAS